MTAKQWTERECRGEYQETIYAAAKILVAAGKGHYVYSTSYISGTTLWHTQAIETNGRESAMVLKDGRIT